jgi:hypothetical protein
MEIRFLLACCQTDPSVDDIEFIRTYLSTPSLSLLALNADTPIVKTKEGCSTITTTASRHGVLPLVYKTLKNLQPVISNPIEDPDTGSTDSQTDNTITIHHHYHSLVTELKAHYQAIAHRNMLMSAELIKILNLLRENHIEALAFKGPTLAQIAYGNITLRQFGDLDILVDEKDAYKAGKLMSKNGHTSIFPLNILSNKICLHTAKEFSFISVPGSVHTELHWRLFEKKYNISLFSYAVEQKCQSVRINGQEISTLQNELLLVYLCLHGAKHAFERIEWICDIDRLIRVSEVDWGSAVSLAEQSHSKRSFYLGLSLVHALFHTTLPATLMPSIQNEAIQTLHTMTLAQMTNKKAERSDFEKNRETFAYQSKLFDTKCDMLRFRLSTFFKISTNDCQTFKLPKQLKLLYLILRPIRLASSYIDRLFHST